VKAKRIRLYIKPGCPWCREAVAWLNHRGFAHETYDVFADPAAYEEMIRLTGQSLAPVIEVDGQVLADFGATELARWWEDRESI